MTQMNLPMKQKQTHRHREQTYGRQGGGMDWEFVISRCKLSCIGRINSKAQLYTPRNYIQHPVINHSRSSFVTEFP